MISAGLSVNVHSAGSEMRAICSVDVCRHSWVVAYLPMDMGKFAKLLKGAACPMCGDDKPNIAPSMPMADLGGATIGALPAAAMAWLSGNDRGMSSQAIFDHMASGRCKGDYPYDPDDLGRCLRLLDAVSEWKQRIEEMRVYSRTWALYAVHWGELAQLMTDEVGIDWSKGRSAPKTYDRMQQLQRMADV
jgi:hypothetical protein